VVKGTQLVPRYNPHSMCPLCCTCGGFDTVECTHCGALIQERNETHIIGIFKSSEDSRKSVLVTDNTRVKSHRNSNRDYHCKSHFEVVFSSKMVQQRNTTNDYVI